MVGMGEFKFISGVHSELDRKPFMVMDYNTVRTIPYHRQHKFGGLLTTSLDRRRNRPPRLPLPQTTMHRKTSPVENLEFKILPVTSRRYNDINS
jgi:hypothetical protein